MEVVKDDENNCQVLLTLIHIEYQAQRITKDSHALLDPKYPCLPLHLKLVQIHLQYYFFF